MRRPIFAFAASLLLLSVIFMSCPAYSLETSVESENTLMIGISIDDNGGLSDETLRIDGDTSKEDREYKCYISRDGKSDMILPKNDSSEHVMSISVAPRSSYYIMVFVEKKVYDKSLGYLNLECRSVDGNMIASFTGDGYSGKNYYLDPGNATDAEGKILFDSSKPADGEAWFDKPMELTITVKGDGSDLKMKVMIVYKQMK